MKNLFKISLGLAGVVFLSLAVTACRKKINPAHPTPANNRLLSYSKYITPNVGAPVSQNFRFYYDGIGRVTQIAYTSNDQGEVEAGTAQRLMTFSYIKDTIIKTTTAVQISLVMEVDTFIINSSKQLIHAYMPGYEVSFEYYGKLISRMTEYFMAGDVRVSTSSTFTSNNGDILSHVFDGNVTATFKNLVAPLNVTWNYDLTTINHPAVGGLTDQISNYSGYGVAVTAVDADATVVGPFTITSPMWRREEHKVYPDLLNRPGDIYYLQTFTMFGIHVYQNEHLVRSITGTGPLIPGMLNIAYTIDADSRIEQTYVTGYGYMNNSSVVFKLQWETY